MPGVGASVGAHGELAREEKEGEGEEEAGAWLGAAWGAARGTMGAVGEGARPLLLLHAALWLLRSVLYTRRINGREKEEEEEREKKKKRKKKERFFFSNLEISEKNKR
jgi:hypothetical protein